MKQTKYLGYTIEQRIDSTWAIKRNGWLVVSMPTEEDAYTWINSVKKVRKSKRGK